MFCLLPQEYEARLQALLKLAGELESGNYHSNEQIMKRSVIYLLYTYVQNFIVLMYVHKCHVRILFQIPIFIEYNLQRSCKALESIKLTCFNIICIST